MRCVVVNEVSGLSGLVGGKWLGIERGRVRLDKVKVVRLGPLDRLAANTYYLNINIYSF